MADDLLRLLQADAEHLSQRADFYEHYAQHLAEGIERERSRGGAINGGGWRTAAYVATALRFAAQYALVVDPQRAAALLRRAADAYLDLGVSYGYLLLATVDPDAVAQRMFSERARAAAMHAHDERPLAAAAAVHPAQLTYLLLAMSSDRIIASELQGPRRALRERLGAHGTAVVGPQSLPLAIYVTFCDELLRLSEGDSTQNAVQSVEPIIAPLMRMGRGYEDGIRDARINQYLWDRLQAPVDIVDLDIVGMTVLAKVAMERAGMDLDAQVRQTTDLTLATVPMYVGLTLRGPGSSDVPGRDAHLT